MHYSFAASYGDYNDYHYHPHQYCYDECYSCWRGDDYDISSLLILALPVLASILRL